ncbi:mannose-6-phosphate isomerase, class I [Tolumonas lignilytica]|uniref:mannose-6-phosphate isomerase, class I n=1 Tax=Tolumonas lignilytica TaxID=1283284 RepID=UPI0004B84C89|nr:mannose-6-phosphate isomerase, class I [Tolumonas lignilytica]
MSFSSNRIYRMQNPIQNYAWGSKDALQNMYGIANPDGKPQAEIWMGAHPNGCSSLIDETSGATLRLDTFIAQNPAAVLGDAQANFGALPYLFKVLAAAEPLSIQVHPDKASAEIGFAAENTAGVALSAAHRNFKDPNHKPELVYALTPYRAMNGFREFDEIVSLIRDLKLPALQTEMDAFCEQPNSETLRVLFGASLRLQGDARRDTVASLLSVAKQRQQQTAFAEVLRLAEFYPEDMGLFAPLLLNVITLQPGDAMFLYARTPHAYLQGIGLEAMASSDNVLRAGLTPKHMDIDALLANVDFVAKPAAELPMLPMVLGPVSDYPIPVTDFSFSLVDLANEPLESETATALILFCMDGRAVINSGEDTLTLQAGESCFVPAAAGGFNVSGSGKLVQIGSR